MSDWTSRGSDNRDVGCCFYCGSETSHYDNHLEIEVCDDSQCLDEALRCSDRPTRDLVDRFEEGKEDN